MGFDYSPQAAAAAVITSTIGNQLDRRKRDFPIKDHYANCSANTGCMVAGEERRPAEMLEV